MHDGLQLQRAEKALLLLLREPEREISICVGGQVFPSSFGLLLQPPCSRIDGSAQVSQGPCSFSVKNADYL